MYAGVRQIFYRYWSLYGGMKAMLKSPYFHFAILVTMLTPGAWLKPEWWKDVYAILPCLLGFSIAGFTLVFALGDEHFRKVMSRPTKTGESPASIISATFVHFIVVQAVAIFAALICQGTFFQTPQFLWTALSSVTSRPLLFFEVVRGSFWGVSYFFFLYGITLTVAAAMGVFRATGLNQKIQQNRLTSTLTPRQEDQAEEAE